MHIVSYHLLLLSHRRSYFDTFFCFFIAVEQHQKHVFQGGTKVRMRGPNISVRGDQFFHKNLSGGTNSLGGGAKIFVTAIITEIC